MLLVLVMMALERHSRPDSCSALSVCEIGVVDKGLYIGDSDDAHYDYPVLSKYQHKLYERGRCQDLTAYHYQKQESVPVSGEMEDSNGTTLAEAKLRPPRP
jgi:hypothetical protein